MKLITTIIRPEKLADVKAALALGESVILLRSERVPRA